MTRPGMVRLPGDAAFDYSSLERDNYAWPDHVVRLNVTAGLIASLGVESVCDPACGDGSIIITAHRLRLFGRVTLGDISRSNISRLDPPFDADVRCADMLDTLAMDRWELIVLTEILEHVADPLAVLRAARAAGDLLVASSPLDEQEHADCPTHVWSFTRDAYLSLLDDAGWTPTVELTLDPRSAYRWLLVAAS